MTMNYDVNQNNLLGLGIVKRHFKKFIWYIMTLLLTIESISSDFNFEFDFFFKNQMKLACQVLSRSGAKDHKIPW